MFKAFTLVRNLESSAEGLDFGEFTISPVGLRFKELREVFSSLDVNQDDWIFEKSYTQLPLGPQGSAVGGIPNDIEDIWRFSFGSTRLVTYYSLNRRSFHRAATELFSSHTER